MRRSWDTLRPPPSALYTCTCGAVHWTTGTHTHTHTHTHACTHTGTHTGKHTHTHTHTHILAGTIVTSQFRVTGKKNHKRKQEPHYFLCRLLCVCVCMCVCVCVCVRSEE